MAKNLKAKTRSVNKPYEVYTTVDGTWEWRILKHYQSPENEASNPYARVLCAVKSPMTWGGYDLGDVYLAEIKQNAVPVFIEENDSPIGSVTAQRYEQAQW